MLKLLALAAVLATAAAAPDYPEIQNFQQIDSTLTSVTLSWTLDVSTYEPIKYTLITADLLTTEFLDDGTNTYTETGLKSCTQYSFDLNAVYVEGAGLVAGIFGSTDYETPGVVEDLTLEGTVISWTAPANARCVDFYRVCWISAVTGVNDCTEVVTSTSYDLGSISGCDDLTVTVVAVGGALTGEASEVHLTSEYAAPGMPLNLEVTPLSETVVELTWDPPLENPACVQEYAITFGLVDNFTTPEVTDEEETSLTADEDYAAVEDVPSGRTITATLDSLEPCSDYRFGVASVSKTGEHSKEAVVYQSTNGSAPGELPDVEFTPDEESITISWGDVTEEACLGVIEICYGDPAEHTWDCVDVPSSPNTWTLDGLGACREYEFRILGKSDDGVTGPPIVISVPTKDVAPGPVQNMALGDITMTSLTVSFDKPAEYPDCADQYVVSYQNILDVASRGVSPRATDYTTDIDGLDACAIYDIGVNAVSPTGLEGPITHQGTTMEQGTPEAPTFASLVARTETSLTVLWYAPTDTRFCVDSYDVKIVGNGQNLTVKVPVLEFNEEILETFSGLSPCSTYSVEIRSTNAETVSNSAFVKVLSDADTSCPP